MEWISVYALGIRNLFEKEDQSRKRVVVWFEVQRNVFEPVCDELPPGINEDSTVDMNSITHD